MNRFAFTILLLVCSNFSSAVTYNVSSENGITELVDPDTGLREFGVDFIPKKFVMIGSSDVITPIATSDARLSVHRAEESLFVASETGEVRTVVAERLTSVSNGVGHIYPTRPTLFVTICGFGGGDNCADMRSSLDSSLLNNGSFQYMHYRVDWDDTDQIDDQDRDLAAYIKLELAMKAHKWDVVVIGYSRGGVFAHDMSEYLVNSDHINNLYTVLLDPTAARELRDIYPRKKHSSALVNHWGSLYYDLSPWSDSTPVNWYEYSDMNISGYNNFGAKDYFVNSNHIAFPSDWFLEDYMLFAYRFINTKQGAGFTEDGIGGVWYVEVDSRSKNIFESGFSTEFGPNGVGMDSYLCVDIDPEGDDLSSLCSSANFSISGEGIYAESVVPAINASRLVITSKRASISTDNNIQQFRASIENGELDLGSGNFTNIAEIETTIDFSEVEVDVTFDFLVDDISININVTDFVGSSSEFLADAEDTIVGAIVGLGDAAGRVGDQLGDDLDNSGIRLDPRDWW